MMKFLNIYSLFYIVTVHFDIYKVHTPTNALFIKLDKDLKFTLKITLTCSYQKKKTTSLYVMRCCGSMCGVCTVRCASEHSTQRTVRTPYLDMLPHHPITYNDVVFTES